MVGTATTMEKLAHGSCQLHGAIAPTTNCKTHIDSDWYFF